MKPLRVIIIDDEAHSINALLWELESLKDPVQVVGTAVLPEEGVRLLKNSSPDILFLDIEMPGMNGFELLQTLDEIDFDIIFTTAYDEFALKAFEVEASDYLLKPVSEEALAKSLSRIRDRKKQEKTIDHLSEMLSRLHLHFPEFRKIALPTLSGLLFIKVDEILHCSSESNYTYIFTVKGDKILISKTLKEIENLIMDPRFLRVHHSHLINLMCIKEYHKGKGGSLLMDDGTNIPVAKNRKKELMERF
jgi:two-component system LytT family response regulator